MAIFHHRSSQLFFACGPHQFQAAELLQQLVTVFCAHAGYLIELARKHARVAARAVVGDSIVGKAVPPARARVEEARTDQPIAGFQLQKDS